MNYTLNDAGNLVPAIGSPGSPTRVKIENPVLIETINELFFKSENTRIQNLDIAIAIIKHKGLNSVTEVRSIIENTLFAEQDNWKEEFYDIFG